MAQRTGCEGRRPGERDVADQSGRTPAMSGRVEGQGCSRPTSALTYNLMVVDQGAGEPGLTDDEVARISGPLADGTRRDIVRRTLVGEVSASALASSYDMSFAAVQK